MQEDHHHEAPAAPPRWMRWAVLVSVSLVCFAQYFVYDSVTPLATQMKSELHLSGSQYGLLFTWYSVPNVFLAMVVVAGVLVDRLGIKVSGVLYAALCVLGAAITALGASPALPSVVGAGAHETVRTMFFPDVSAALKVMLLGRMVYGLGAEAILIVNNKVLARWFQGKELAFAYGLNLTVMRLGTFLALYFQASVSQKLGLAGALWAASGLMTLGFLSFFAYLALERLAVRRFAMRLPAPAPEGKFKLREVFGFDASFWFITLLCVTFYSAVFPFQSYSTDILVQKFHLSATAAGRYASALIVGTMIFTPIFGWLVDRKGKRATLMMLGALLLIPCHLLLGYTRFPPVVPIFLVGVALSLVPAALWAAIPMMAPEQRLGTAFGLVGYVQNVGLLAFPWIAGKIADAHTTVKMVDGQKVTEVDYTSTMLMFALLGIAGLVFAVLLKRADARKKSGFSIESVAIA
jgi:MFS family permease